ncbi:MAG: peptidase S10 [Chloroflexota bacterium]|jgi:carboxypeptidase C (cathepsin A)
MTDNDKNGSDKKKDLPQPEEQTAVTHHSVTIDGRSYQYTVTTGTMILKEEEEEDDKAQGEKPKATLFYVAYTLDEVDGEPVETGQRPLTFSFNGGPGSSSVWLHLGVLGPRRVAMGDEDGRLGPPPYQLVDNEQSLLDKTDLVFIDPVSTGFSRAVPGEKPKAFHEFEKDIESVGDFIRLYTSRNGRWTSPKFLIGESYGTTRAGGLSGYLQQRHGMYFNGLMLVSSVLNFQTLYFTPGNDLPYILYLPTYTATAFYHDKLDDDLQQDLQQTLAEVNAFALNEYTLALMQGAALPAAQRADIVAQVARYTGLSPDYVERSNLRIRIDRFCKELRRDEGITVGRLDSRYTGFDRDSVGESFEFDPSYAAIQGPYTATFNDYVRRDLKFESDLPYEILTDKVWPWNYKKFQNSFVDVAETLRQAIAMNPYLKVYVANGYFDLATPYLATEYTFNHLGLPSAQQENISMGYFEAGHMMYLHLPSLAQLKEELAAFVETAV